MTKTKELIDAIKAGTHRISDQGFVQRRATEDHAFSGTRAGDWITTYKWRGDVVVRAAAAIQAINPFK